MNIKTKLYSGLAGTVGYLLSPMSWWNDAYVNLPIAYVLSVPFSFFGRESFIAVFISIYWLTNVAGLYLLHKSAKVIISKDDQKQAANIRREILFDIIVSIVYTTIVAALIILNLLPIPNINDYVDWTKN